jgi:apolipoprotein N-acyltransferase
MKRVRRPARAVLAGACIALSMPPWGWWPLAVAGLALVPGLVAGTRRRTRFGAGWLLGLAWLVPSTVWMLDFSPPGYVVAAGLLSGFVGLALAVLPAGQASQALALPGVITLAEFARTVVPFGGVPLSTLAMSQVASPLAGVARVGGTVALTLVTVAAAVAVAAALTRAWRPALFAVAAVAVAMTTAAVAPAGRDLGPFEVALVQGGGPQRTRAVDTDAGAVFERHLAASSAVRTPVDLVLWPENVVSVNGPLEDTPQEAALADLAARLDATVVPGIVESLPGRFYNASVVIEADGSTTSRYDKVRRVPFGEYVPFRSTMDALSGGMVSRYVPNDAVAGTGPAVVQTPYGVMGVVISWEVFFERRARDAIVNGGEVLMNPTNGSSYWLTIVQSQQVASSRLRALETGRWVLQAAPTGFSAVVSPDGTVQQRTGISETAVLQQTVQRRDGLTWSVRFGPWPSLALACGLVAAGHLITRRGGGRSGGRPAAPGPAEDLEPATAAAADGGVTTVPAGLTPPAAP